MCNGISLNSSSSPASKVKNTTKNSVQNFCGRSSIDVKRGLFCKDQISGFADGVKYDIQKLNTFGRKIDFYGMIGDQEAYYNINKGFGIIKPDVVSGKIGDEEFNLTFKKNIFGNSEITGTYKNEPINLKLKANPGFKTGYTLEGDNTNCKIDYQLFSNNMKSDGDFGYDKDLLPVLFTYINEAVVQKQNDEAAAMMNMM